MKGPDSRAARTTPDQDTGLTTQANDAAPPPAVVPVAGSADALPLQTARLLTRQQAAAYCGVTSDTFDDYRRRGIVLDTRSPQEERVTRCNIYTGSVK